MSTVGLAFTRELADLFETELLAIPKQFLLENRIKSYRTDLEPYQKLSCKNLGSVYFEIFLFA